MSTASKMAVEWAGKIWANEVKDEQENKSPFGQIISVRDAYLAGFAACVEEARKLKQHMPAVTYPGMERIEEIVYLSDLMELVGVTKYTPWFGGEK